MVCHALAAHATPSVSPCEAAPVGQTIEAALQALRSLEPECHKQPHFLYTLGRLLNQVGRYDEAIDPLEGALLYRPDHWPSQLEYAIALEGIGDHHSATGLLQGLLQNPALDAPTRQQLAQLQRKPLRPVLTRHRGSFSLATGYDNNLLGSTYHTEFMLTSPAGVLPVQLAPDQRPQAGSFVRAEASYAGAVIADPSTPWRYNLAASYRASPSFRRADVGQFSALLERGGADEQGLYLRAQHQTLVQPDAVALQQTQLGLGYDARFGSERGCQQRLGLDLQRLSYPANPALNGRYTGLISNTHCPAWGLQVQARAGHDQPIDASRPGGAQHQYSLRASQRIHIHTSTLALEVEATRQHDQSGYSALLDNNARRNIKRVAYRLEYRWQAGAVSPYLGLEWLNQRSNLSLFELNNRVLTLGFRFDW